MIKIILPIPNSDLGSNIKNTKHYKDVKAKNAAKELGYWSAVEAFNNYSIEVDKGSCIACLVNVYHKNNKHLDDDNLITAMKPFQDGIFDFLEFKLGINDKQIKYRVADTRGIDKENPRVEYTLIDIKNLGKIL